MATAIPATHPSPSTLPQPSAHPQDPPLPLDEAFDALRSAGAAGRFHGAKYTKSSRRRKPRWRSMASVAVTMTHHAASTSSASIQRGSFSEAGRSTAEAARLAVTTTAVALADRRGDAASSARRARAR
jgi:hypothetical protein